MSGRSPPSSRRSAGPGPPHVVPVLRHRLDRARDRARLRASGVRGARRRPHGLLRVLQERRPADLARRPRGQPAPRDAPDRSPPTARSPSASRRRSATRRTRRYTYDYDANRNMTEDGRRPVRAATASRGSATTRTTVLLTVNERWENGKDTELRYDETVSSTQRRTDGDLRDPTRTARTAAARARASPMTRAAPSRRRSSPAPASARARSSRTGSRRASGRGGSAATASSIRPSTRTPSAATRARTPSLRATDRYFYRSDGRLIRKVRDPRSGPSDTQEYTYDDNGNRNRDERGTHTFNARNQLTSWTKSGRGTVRYEVNGTGAVTAKTDRGVRTRVRTSSATASSGRRRPRTAQNATVNYCHSDFGNVVRITTLRRTRATTTARSRGHDVHVRRVRAHDREQGAGSGSGLVFLRRDRPARLQDAQRDPHRLRLHRALRGPLARDARGQLPGLRLRLERRALRLHAHATPRARSPTAPTSSTPAARCSGSRSTSAWSPTTAYECDPTASEQGRRRSRRADLRLQGWPTRRATSPSASRASTTTRASRRTTCRPGHTGPTSGRFLPSDRYQSSAGDFNLQSDPLTQNRYAFAGGNPVNRVEWDGHAVIVDDGPDKGATIRALNKQAVDEQKYRLQKEKATRAEARATRRSRCGPRRRTRRAGRHGGRRRSGARTRNLASPAEAAPGAAQRAGPHRRSGRRRGRGGDPGGDELAGRRQALLRPDRPARLGLARRRLPLQGQARRRSSIRKAKKLYDKINKARKFADAAKDRVSGLRFAGGPQRRHGGPGDGLRVQTASSPGRRS